jgi:hypothetical protein
MKIEYSKAVDALYVRLREALDNLVNVSIENLPMEKIAS